jgi:flavin-dependent dehydrogenase
MTYDAIVIGAGTNGGTAACFLAQKGFKTLLIEASATPGEKCQGATEYAPGLIYHNRPHLVDLMVRVIKKIPHLNPGDLGKAHHYYYVNAHNEVVFKSMAAAPGETGQQASYSVHNCDFVRALSEEAVQAGAELQTRTKVVDLIRKDDVIKGVITESGDEIGARLTIAADGRISTIAKKAGLLKKWDANVCYYQYGEAWKFRSEEEMFEYVEYARHVFYGPTLTPPQPWGGCTMSPRPGGIVTVNAPTGFTPLSAMVRSQKPSRAVYMRNLYNIMEVKRMLCVCEGFPDKPYQRQSAFLPGPPLKKPYMAGLLICGDAGAVGGLCDAGERVAAFAAPLLEQNELSEEALSGFAVARLPEIVQKKLKGSDKNKGGAIFSKELGEVSPTRIVYWSTGGGYMDKHQCSMEQVVNNMRLAAVPHVMGAPSPEKCGEFGYEEMGAWLIAVKINHLLNLYGPILQDPSMFPRILKWVQKNQQSFNENKVYDHPF